MLIPEILLKLKPNKGNFTATLLQVDLNEDGKVYVEMPIGFKKKGKCLKLKKTLYGL